MYLRFLILLMSFAWVGASAKQKTNVVIDASVGVPPMALPQGLVAEVAAAPPLTRYPMMGNFDDRGRLFVAEAAGVNRTADELDVEKPNFIRLLEDTNRDGLFDKSTVFAADLTFPSGALWHDGALWVTAAPSIWRLEDTDDDGVADKREAIVTGFGYTGNAADLHGPFLHPNGRIFWSHGRKALEVYDKEGTLIHRGKGARIWSCEPDGSDVQIYAGGGMDNPVEIVFTPEGEIIGDINLMYGRPRGDTLVHWQYGGVYPRYDQETVLAEFVRTGDLMKEFYNFGHVAVSGMNLYQSPHGLGDYAGNLFTTHFNTQKVTRSVVEADGASFRHLQEEDFLKIDDPDVHLTDVMEDANGDLLVIDTGGWFRNGCPVSQIAKPEVAGAIYRVRKAGVRDRETDYRGRQVDWVNASSFALAELLGDKHFAKQNRAVAALAKRGDGGLPALEKALASESVAVRRNAVWALTRIGSSQARILVRKALRDPSQSVRHTACNSIWKSRDSQAVGELLQLLKEESPPVQMAAARALGRTGDAAAVPDLLNLITQPLDRVTEHAAIFALIEINDFSSTVPALNSQSPELRRRVLWALDGMRDSRLKANQALRLLSSPSEPLVAAVTDICKLHPDWVGEIVETFNRWREGNQLRDERLKIVNELASFYLNDKDMQAFIGRFFQGDSDERTQAFRIIANSPQPLDLHRSWIAGIELALGGDNPEMVVLALDALAKINSEHFDDRLRAIGDDVNRSVLMRVKALGAVSGAGGQIDQVGFTLLKRLLGPASSSSQRLEAVKILSNAQLTKQQLLELAPFIERAGPVELPLLVDLFNQSRDSDTGFALVDALKSASSINTVSPSELQRLLALFPPEVLDRAKPLIDQLFDSAEQRKTRMAEMARSLESGDPLKGEDVFVSGKGACIACHRVGKHGRDVGPDLSRIGQIRTKGDLLESILFPSATLARDFEPYQIETTDGQIYFGVIQRETSDTLFLVDVSAVAKPIPRSTIKKIRPGSVSLMPKGLDQAMTKQELLDLIAYLDSRE